MDRNFVKRVYEQDGNIFIQLNTQERQYHLKRLKGLDCYIIGRKYIYKDKEPKLYQQIDLIKQKVLSNMFQEQMKKLKGE
jgi:hypothetical protein